MHKTDINERRNKSLCSFLFFLVQARTHSSHRYVGNAKHYFGIIYIVSTSTIFHHVQSIFTYHSCLSIYTTKKQPHKTTTSAHKYYDIRLDLHHYDTCPCPNQLLSYYYYRYDHSWYSIITTIVENAVTSHHRRLTY